MKKIIILKCVRNEICDDKYDLQIGKYYAMDKIIIGQSYSTVYTNNNCYNSILFNYYKIIDDRLVEFDIYHSEYSPYFRVKEQKEDAED